MIYDCISDDIPPQLKIFNLVYDPHSNALLQFCLKLGRCKLHKAILLSNEMRHNSSHYFKHYIAGHTVANFDIIQSDVVLQNQVH